MSEYRNIIVFILCILQFFTFRCLATETIIVGEVMNETTGEAIPNVNIHFRGTKIGTTSDENGNYVLRVDMQDKAQLVFSAIGYYSQRFEITPGVMAGLQVAMKERSTMLAEVVVAPNENPALEILRQVRSHRSENDRTLHPESTADLRRTQTLYVSHISKRHLRRALWRSLQSGMILQEDSTYIMPLYRETQTFRFSGEDITPANDRQTQTIVLSETDYSSLLGGEGNLNFYAPSVSIMGHAFLSPLAAGGNLYYRYYLTESATNDSTAQNSREVTIAFRTRNPFYATFNGEMVIDTTSYALRAIQAYVPSEVAVNYVNNLHVSQTLLPDGTIAEEHLSALLDFVVKTGQAGTIFPTLLLTTSLTNPTGEAGLTAERSYSPPDGPVGEAGLARDSAFAALDSLPVIRVAKWFATIAATGYIPTGTFLDIGHVEEILQVNHHESVHVGLPFRTNERFSKVVSLEAAVGYGVKDRRAKGLGRISVNLPALHPNTLQLEYREGYVWSEVDDFDRQLRENSMGLGNFDFTAYAFEALHRDNRCINTAMYRRQLQLRWFADWGQFSSSIGPATMLETQAYIRAGRNDLYAPYTVHRTPYSYQSLSLLSRLSWGERKYDGFFSRKYAYSSRYPVLFTGLEFGHWSHTTGAGLYAHLRLLLTHHAQLGMGGTLNYAFQAGAIFGEVPATLLWHASANQGYAYDPYRFTLLHGYELMADKYLALQAEWNGQGILFNLIPGVRWLHLRELVETKIAYGYLAAPHRTLTGSDAHTLYTEIGVGIGNILRVCDLYSVWSLSPQVQWALRFRIHLGL